MYTVTTKAFFFQSEYETILIITTIKAKSAILKSDRKVKLSSISMSTRYKLLASCMVSGISLSYVSGQNRTANAPIMAAHPNTIPGNDA